MPDASHSKTTLDPDSSIVAAGSSGPQRAVGPGAEERPAGATDPFEVPSLCCLFQRTAAAAPERVALRTADGQVTITWGEYAARVRAIAGGLHSLGVGHGDTVALMMTNRPEFHLCDTAAMHLGAAAFSVYNTLTPETIQHVLLNAGARVVLCEPEFLDKVEAARGGTEIEHVICIDGLASDPPSLGWLESRDAPGFDFDAAWRAVERQDLLTLIYTSGTTGPPKGVELTHGNMLAELRATATILPLEHGDSVPSVFPMAHAAERWGSHYRGIAHGLEVTCVDDLGALPQVLTELRPTVWGSVPRVWEKLYASLQTAFAAEPDEARRAAISWAIDVGLRAIRAEQEQLRGDGPGPDAELRQARARADELVFGGLRQRLGLDRVRWAIVGAAPTPRHVLEFFAAIGIPLCELWGMSELTTVATVNPPSRAKLGTVGPALPGTELRLAGDGEVLVRGEIVMRGYRHDPEKTAEALDAEGWLHTGDIGTLDDHGYLSIVDRKKELIINAAGKNMSPANIEASVKGASPLIAHAVAIGDRRPYNVALIAIDLEACAPWAEAHGLADLSLPGIAESPEIRRDLNAAIAAANDTLARVEQIKRFAIIGDIWEPGGEELTPTLKLKRRNIAQRYAADIDLLYES